MFASRLKMKRRIASCSSVLNIILLLPYTGTVEVRPDISCEIAEEMADLISLAPLLTIQEPREKVVGVAEDRAFSRAL